MYLNDLLKKSLSSLVVLLVLSTSAFSTVKFKRSFKLDLNEIAGVESTKNLVNRLRKNLKTDFKLDKNDYTYYFLERYFQLYSNEPKGIMEKPVILTAKYNSNQDDVQTKIEVHYYKNDINDVHSTVVNGRLKILKIEALKKDAPYGLSFEFQSSYNFIIKQLIGLYVNSSDGTRFIQDFTKTAIIYNPKEPNFIEIELDYTAYGGSLKESVIATEIAYTKNVTIKFIEELRLKN